MRTPPGTRGSSATIDLRAGLLASATKMLATIDALPESRILQAVDLMGPGPIITTGVGKSGHAARRASSVFATLGTPAMFVHPVDALHGDLGVVQAAEAVLAISHSGDTPEVVRFARHARDLEVPVIALCGRQSSRLASVADCVLHLPAVNPNEPVLRAPLIASQAQSIVCDLLALTLAERGGFTLDDHARLHPAGPSIADRADS